MHQNTRANYLHVKTWLLLGNKANSVAETSPHQVLSVANVSRDAVRSIHKIINLCLAALAIKSQHPK